MKHLHPLLIIVALALAYGEWWPYGYYVLLRIVVCGSFAFWAWQAYEAKREVFWKIYTATALLYQPLIPLHLGRDVWEYINALTIALAIHFLYSRFKANA